MMRLIKRLILLISRRRGLVFTFAAIWIFICFLLSFTDLSGKYSQDAVKPVAKPKKSPDPSHPKMLKIHSYCNHADQMTLTDEFLESKNLTLTKVAILIRHGDRGPLRSVRGLSSVRCDPRDTQVFGSPMTQNLHKLIEARLKIAKVLRFPLAYDSVPRGICQLGQLTLFGALQHVTLGSLLSEMYLKTLDIQQPSRKTVSVRTTAYPRTFQSAVAFLHGFFQPETSLDYKLFPFISPTEGTYFCSGTHCKKPCPMMDSLHGKLVSYNRDMLKSHPALIRLVHELQPMVVPSPNITSMFSTPVALHDGLMAYLCHHHSMPCQTDKVSGSETCVTFDHIRQIVAYVEFHGKHMSALPIFKHLNWLKIYPFLSDISEQFEADKPKFELYSAHDITVVPVASVLDFYDGTLPPYASRVIFEIYEHDDLNKYIRIIYNGKDVTRLTEICKIMNSCLQLDIENNVRQLIAVKTFRTWLKNKFHQVTKANNFQDACKPSKEL